MTQALASMEDMACQLSRHVKGAVVLFRSQNVGDVRDYRSMDALGEDIVTQLVQEEVAFAVYPEDKSSEDYQDYMEIFYSLEGSIPDNRIIGLSACIYKNGAYQSMGLWGTGSEQYPNG